MTNQRRYSRAKGDPQPAIPVGPKSEFSGSTGRVPYTTMSRRELSRGRDADEEIRRLRAEAGGSGRMTAGNGDNE